MPRQKMHFAPQERGLAVQGLDKKARQIKANCVAVPTIGTGGGDILAQHRTRLRDLVLQAFGVKGSVNQQSAQPRLGPCRIQRGKVRHPWQAEHPARGRGQRAMGVPRRNPQRQPPAGPERPTAES